MTKEELIQKLRDLNKGDDPEEEHIEADLLLLEYINDSEISDAYKNIEKWYS